jgi:predicted nucleic acid-binding protein
MFLFDSSCIIEILKNEPAIVEKYKDATLVTISLAYGEAYLYCLKKNLDIKQLKKFSINMVEFSLNDIEEAMELLYTHKKKTKDFSFVDAVVYTVAKKNNIVLVTKDLGFKGLSNVELIREIT